MSLQHATELLPAITAARSRAGHLLVGLDYDGTLTPIVERPEAARLSDDARTTLGHLADRPDTRVAILSGRALADVRLLVGLPGLYYAGNHGLELAGPGLDRVHPGAAAARTDLRAAVAALRPELAGFPGAQLEDKGVTISVHYRRVARQSREAVREVALRTGGRYPTLRCTEGKMVVELRPAVDWHKGSALDFIRRSLPGGATGPALFVGDDRTDEDAFRALAAGDWGIVVAAAPPAHTAASAWLAAPDEVLALLRELARDPVA